MILAESRSRQGYNIRGRAPWLMRVRYRFPKKFISWIQPAINRYS